MNPAGSTSRFWLWPNLLSLDAPAVALLWQLLFLRCFHAEVTAAAAVLLVLAVWLIYAADRVMDARGESQLPRHEFYRRNLRLVIPFWIAGVAAAGWLAWTRLSPELFERGVLLMGAVAFYFAAVHIAPSRTTWPKEAAVAVLFALGASLAAWGHVRSAVDAATILLFFCLCWINCAAIEKWERRKKRWPVGVAAICVAAAAILVLYPARPVLGSAEAASALAFVVLDRGRNRFSRDALRVLADVALLSPVFFLPIAGMIALIAIELPGGIARSNISGSGANSNAGGRHFCAMSRQPGARCCSATGTDVFFAGWSSRTAKPGSTVWTSAGACLTRHGSGRNRAG